MRKIRGFEVEEDGIGLAGVNAWVGVRIGG